MFLCSQSLNNDMWQKIIIQNTNDLMFAQLDSPIISTEVTHEVPERQQRNPEKKSYLKNISVIVEILRICCSNKLVLRLCRQ